MILKFTFGNNLQFHCTWWLQNNIIIAKHMKYTIVYMMFLSFKILFLVQRFIKEDKLPHLLFYGPPGTGKTSTILAVARQLYSPSEFNSMVLEVGWNKEYIFEVNSNSN